MTPSSDNSNGKAKRTPAERLVQGQYFFVKEHRNKSGTLSYRVEGTPPATSVNPKPERVRDNFPTLAEAQNHFNDLELAAQNIKTTEKILLHATRLNSQQLKKAELAFDELAGAKPERIVEAVLFWKQHNGGIDKTMGLREALKRCTADKAAAGRAKNTIDGYRFAVESFLHFCGEPTGELDESGQVIKDIPIANITRQALKKWVESYPVRNTGLCRLRALSAVLTWCVDNDYLKTNWAIDLPLEDISEKPKHISMLANGQSRIMLDKAAAYEQGAGMPYVVVCLFCAIRPEEAPQIEVDEVNLEKKFIRLHHTKTGRKRVVELSENAAAMLRFYWKKGKGSFGISRRIMAILKAAAGFRDSACPISERPQGWEDFPRWPVDVMRHTGLSNKLAATNDVMKTTRWGGNSPQVFYEHYHGLVSADEAAQFWSMLPDSMPRSPELMERIQLELVEWGLLKKGQSLPAGPEVPQRYYPKKRQKVELLSIPLEQLKALVWECSLKVAATRFGCSAVFLHRYCRHKNIPTPPRGYWTQIRAQRKTKVLVEETQQRPAETQTPAIEANSLTSSVPGSLAPMANKANGDSDLNLISLAGRVGRAKGIKVTVEAPIPRAPRAQSGLIDWPKIPTDDLRRLVWTYPTMRIATEWGVWENAIRKQLKKRGIVPPPPGYWAKVAAGHIVPRSSFFQAA